MGTRSTRIASSVKLFPTHCKMPTISEEDETIVAAAELMTELASTKKTMDCEQKVKYATILKQLADIIKHRPPQRVVPGTPQRVNVPSTSNNSPQRVGTPSTSSDPTAPRNAKTSKLIYQRKTRSNTPMDTIPEKDDTGSDWYNSERPPKNKKKNAKTKTKTNRTNTS